MTLDKPDKFTAEPKSSLDMIRDMERNNFRELITVAMTDDRFLDALHNLFKIKVLGTITMTEVVNNRVEVIRSMLDYMVKESIE